MSASMSAHYMRALRRCAAHSCIHRAYIVHTSCIHRAYIVHTSCTHSAHIAHTERTQSAHIVHSRLFPPFVACSPKSLLLPPVASTNVLLSGLPWAQHNYQNLPFLESPYRARNIVTSNWLATSKARMKRANMRANQDLENRRDFGEHAAEGGNNCGFDEHTIEGGNKRDFG